MIKFLIVKIVSILLYFFSSIQVKDPTNGFRMFSKKIIKKFPIKSTVGFAYSLELLVKAKKHNVYKGSEHQTNMLFRCAPSGNVIGHMSMS